MLCEERRHSIAYQVTGEGAINFVEHWDGSNWSIVPSPTQGNSSLLAVTLATTTASAVGESGNQPLVMKNATP